MHVDVAFLIRTAWVSSSGPFSSWNQHTLLHCNIWGTLTEAYLQPLAFRRPSSLLPVCRCLCKSLLVNWSEEVVVSDCACVKSMDQDYGAAVLPRWQSTVGMNCHRLQVDVRTKTQNTATRMKNIENTSMREAKNDIGWYRERRKRRERWGRRKRKRRGREGEGGKGRKEKEKEEEKEEEERRKRRQRTKRKERRGEGQAVEKFVQDKNLNSNVQTDTTSKTTQDNPQNTPARRWVCCILIEDALFYPALIVMVHWIQSVCRDIPIGHSGAVWIDRGTLRRQMRLFSKSVEPMVG